MVYSHFNIEDFKREFSSLSLGLRLNNIGCIRFSKDNRWIGQKGSFLGFCNFEKFEFGVRALVIVLMRYITKYRLFDIHSIISRYAPPSENKTNYYIKFVISVIGFDKFDNYLPVLKEQIKMLVFAISCVENGARFLSCSFENGFKEYLFDLVDKYFDEYCNNVIFPVYGKIEKI